MTVAVGILRLPGHDPALPLPAYATDGAAGMDLCANLAPADRAEGLTLPPAPARWSPPGLALEIPRRPRGPAPPALRPRAASRA